MSERKMLVEYVRENDGAFVSVWIIEAKVKVWSVEGVEVLLPRCDAYGEIPPKTRCEECVAANGVGGIEFFKNSPCYDCEQRIPGRPDRFKSACANSGEVDPR